MTESDLMDRYARGGLAGGLTPGQRPALIVVDLQRGFTDPSCGPGFEMPDVVAATHDLVDTARAHGVPIFFTTISFPQGGSWIWLDKMPVLDVLRPGSGWDDLDPATGYRDGDEVVVKQAASAFAGTDLLDRLRALGVDTVVVCGATTSGCVRATVVDAIAAEFRPYVPEQAVGDREKSPHDAALVDIRAKYGEIVDMSAAMRVLEGAL